MIKMRISYKTLNDRFLINAWLQSFGKPLKIKESIKDNTKRLYIEIKTGKSLKNML